MKLTKIEKTILYEARLIEEEYGNLRRRGEWDGEYVLGVHVPPGYKTQREWKEDLSARSGVSIDVIDEIIKETEWRGLYDYDAVEERVMQAGRTPTSPAKSMNEHIFGDRERIDEIWPRKSRAEKAKDKIKRRQPGLPPGFWTFKEWIQTLDEELRLVAGGGEVVKLGRDVSKILNAYRKSEYHHARDWRDGMTAAMEQVSAYMGGVIEKLSDEIEDSIDPSNTDRGTAIDDYLEKAAEKFSEAAGKRNVASLFLNAVIETMDLASNTETKLKNAWREFVKLVVSEKGGTPWRAEQLFLGDTVREYDYPFMKGRTETAALAATAKELPKSALRKEFDAWREIRAEDKAQKKAAKAERKAQKKAAKAASKAQES